MTRFCFKVSFLQLNTLAPAVIFVDFTACLRSLKHMYCHPHNLVLDAQFHFLCVDHHVNLTLFPFLVFSGLISLEAQSRSRFDIESDAHLGLQ